jgi:hypothetical protein
LRDISCFLSFGCLFFWPTKSRCSSARRDPFSGGASVQSSVEEILGNLGKNDRLAPGLGRPADGTNGSGYACFGAWPSHADARGVPSGRGFCPNCGRLRRHYVADCQVNPTNAYACAIHGRRMRCACAPIHSITLDSQTILHRTRATRVLTPSCDAANRISQLEGLEPVN